MVSVCHSLDNKMTCLLCLYFVIVYINVHTACTYMEECAGLKLSDQ